MELDSIKSLVAETGRLLLEKKLVARTWGNISCRIDDSTFAITPSGLDYVTMKPEDISVFDMRTGEWTGRKPSSEKGVHAAAYETFSDVKFVIHTHQDNATAIGLTGAESLKVTVEETERLGGIAFAEYGLPGTKKLKENVQKALQSGAKTIFMVHHGVLVCGNDREDAIAKALLLEEICGRSLQGIPGAVKGASEITESKCADSIRKAVGQRYTFYNILNTPEILQFAAGERKLRAQVDDMAQMIGSCIVPAGCDTQEVIKKLEHHDVVLVKGVGAVVKADNSDDADALALLTEKSVICALHTKTVGKKIYLSHFDTRLMRIVYKMKYSKQKQR